MAFFDLNDIRGETDSGSFRRGMNYYQLGQVLDLEVESSANNQFVQIMGVVSGSRPYQQSVEVSVKKWGVNIDGDCSCPVAYNCKHVVALLLKYLNSIEPQLKKNNPNSEESQKLMLDKWFENLNQINETALQPIEDKPRYWLAYILYESNRSGTVMVKFTKTGIKKAGGYYKPKMVYFYSLENAIYSYNKPEYINEQDQIIISLLKTQKGNFFPYSDLSFKGTVGVQLLQRILATQRCFWEDIATENLLKNGQQKTIRFKWEKETKSKTKSLQLVSDLASNERLIGTEPPYYINIDTKTLGPLKTALTLPQLELMLSMPPVPEQSLNKVSLKLLRDDLEQQVPLPIPMDIHHYNGEQLQPKLRLTRTLDENKSSRFHC